MAYYWVQYTMYSRTVRMWQFILIHFEGIGNSIANQVIVRAPTIVFYSLRVAFLGVVHIFIAA
jgi:hypothetical protein